MNTHAMPSARVIRLPVRPRIVSQSGISGRKRRDRRTLEVIPGSKTTGGITLDRLLEDGTLDIRQRATDFR